MTRILWIGGAAFGLAGLLLYGLGFINPNPVRWAAGSGLAIVVISRWLYCGSPIPKCEVTWCAITFCGYAALSLLWSPDWRQGLNELHGIVVLAAVFIACLHLDRDVLGKAVTLTGTVAILLSNVTTYIYPNINGGLGNRNFEAEFLMGLAPLAAVGVWIWRTSPIGYACLLAACTSLGQAFFFNASNAKYIGIAGALVLLLIVKRRYWSAAVIVSVSSLGIAVSERIWSSLLYRIEFTHNTFLMWLDHPIFGVGLGGYNYSYPLYQEAHLKFLGISAVNGLGQYAGAAHDEYVQALAMFGVVGAAILAAIIVLSLRSKLKRGPLEYAALISVGAYAGMSAVGFPLQNASTALIAVVALALASRRGPCGYLRRTDIVLDQKRSSGKAVQSRGCHRA